MRVWALSGLSRYRVERLGTSKPVSHMAQTIAIRKGWSGFLKADSRSILFPSSRANPSLISLRCSFISSSRSHFLNLSTSFCSSLMTTTISVSSIQAICFLRKSSSCSSAACFISDVRRSIRFCQHFLRSLCILTQVTLSIQTSIALPDSHPVE
ncbi:MAG: hypothetical protein BWY05_01463 [Euryarchaeota archaeon ADurb.Bin165]|nr:MAG: hypothetical protein BWY05_01463 [Euryarchaeota archaeon ADurb.Bin165]